MRALDLISLSTRMFKTRPMRTFLTVLGVSIGIGAVLFLVSLGYGLQNTILNKITTADSLLSLDVTPGVGGLVGLNKETVEYMKKLSQVEEVSPVTSLTGQMTQDKLTGDCLINTVSPSFFRLQGMTVKYGNILTNEGYEAIISSAGAKLFNLSQEQILNKEFSLVIMMQKKEGTGNENKDELEVIDIKNKFRVVGVVDDDNSSFVYIPDKTIEGLVQADYSQLKVKVKDSAFLEPVRGMIIDKGFSVSSLSDTIEQANKIFGIIQIILSLFGIIALIVSAIGMFNTMTIALLERTNEIGIMRAIGVTRRDMLLLFLMESSLMGLLGGVGGVAVGYLGGEIANTGLNILAKTMGGQTLNLFYRPLWFILVIIVFSTVIGFFTGVYPSIRAARMNPLEALRYK
jgi:putative ABC transport system permease protein